LAEEKNVKLYVYSVVMSTFSVHQIPSDQKYL